MDLGLMGPLVAVFAPLVGVPLAMITLYLRTIRDHQSERHAELVQRGERVEQALAELRRAVDGFERDYATKEEWLREAMSARQQLARLTEMVSRLQAGVEQTEALTATFLRAVRPAAGRSAGDDVTE